jgi:hypothetical protein
MKRNAFILCLLSLGTACAIFPGKVWGYATSCSEVSCGQCTCEGWPGDNDGCSGCGHPLCKRNSCGCGYSNCCYIDPTTQQCVACLDLCECGCSGSPPADPDPTSTPTPIPTPTSTPTPTACPAPPAPVLNSPGDGACIATGSYVDLTVNGVSNTCGGNTAEYQMPFTYQGNSYPGAYQDSTTRSTGPYGGTGTATWYARARYFDSYYGVNRESGNSSPRSFEIGNLPGAPVLSVNVSGGLTSVPGSDPLCTNDQTPLWTWTDTDPGGGCSISQTRMDRSWSSVHIWASKVTSFESTWAFNHDEVAYIRTAFYNSLGWGAYSDQARARIDVQAPPAPSISCTPSGNRVTCSWNAVADSGCASLSITGSCNHSEGLGESFAEWCPYLVEIRYITPFPSVQVYGGLWYQTQSVDLINLSSGNYSARVRARDRFNQKSGWSATAFFTIGGPTPTPTNTPTPGGPSPTPTNTPTPTPTPVPGNIIGRIFVDENEDAARQAGETIIDSGGSPDVLIWYWEGDASPQFAGSTTHCTGNPGDYQASSIPPGTYQVRMTLNTADWVFTRSGFGSYATDPGSASCSWASGSGLSTVCEAGSGDSCTQIVADGLVVNPAQTRYVWAGVHQVAQPWFQIRGGGAHFDGGASVSVPSGEYLVVPDGSRSAAGAVSHAWGTLSLGGGEVSMNGWQVDNQGYQSPIYEVEYFSRRLSNSDIEVTLIDVDSERTLSEISVLGCAGAGSTCQVSADQKVLVRKAGEGEFTIDRDVSIARGGFLGVMSEGNLEIAGEVNALDGLYLANGDVTIADGASQLTVNGMVVGDADFTGTQGVVVNRDIGTSSPSVVFNYDPNLVFSMPRELWKKRFDYQYLLP